MPRPVISVSGFCSRSCLLRSCRGGPESLIRMFAVYHRGQLKGNSSPRAGPKTEEYFGSATSSFHRWRRVVVVVPSRIFVRQRHALGAVPAVRGRAPSPKQLARVRERVNAQSRQALGRIKKQMSSWQQPAEEPPEAFS